MEVALLPQVPPATASLSGSVKPTITVLPPEIAAGDGLTVKVTITLLVPSV